MNAVMPGSRRHSTTGRPSQPCRLGEIDAEAVAFPLIAAGHFGAGVTEMFLDMGLLDLRGAGEACAKGMAGEGAFAFALGEVAANAGGQCGFCTRRTTCLSVRRYARSRRWRRRIWP